MEYKVVLEYDSEEECWVTFVPSLDDISTWGKSKEEVLEKTREAIAGYLEALKKKDFLCLHANLSRSQR